MTKAKVFVAHISQNIAGYELSAKRLILANSLQEAENYARSPEGMAVFDGSSSDDGNSYQESDNPNTWFFWGGEWSATLNQIVEIEDPETAKHVVISGLISFL